MSEYPKDLIHPGYQRAVIKTVTETDSISGRRSTDHVMVSPDRWPPVTVKNPDQEARHRAMGYREFGERQAMIEFSEYPLMLQHPDFIAAVPDESFAQKDANTGEVKYWTVKGRPAQFPPVQVNNPEEEEAWTAKGYRRPGKSDPDAAVSAIASPHVAGRVVEEYPKMVNGKMVDPRPVSTIQEYPKWAHDVVVQTEEEHRERFPQDFSERDEFNRLMAGTQFNKMPGQPPVVTVPLLAPLDNPELDRLRAENAALLAKLAASEKPKKRRGRPPKAKPQAEQPAA